MTATFKGGVLQNLTIVNATLANGLTLNVVTNSGVSPTSSNFITGTLTVTATGATYEMEHWHVDKDNDDPSPSTSPSPSSSPGATPTP
jgi:hypothetical protein